MIIFILLDRQEVSSNKALEWGGRFNDSQPRASLPHASKKYGHIFQSKSNEE